jgi:hypothetical protein
MSAATPRKPAAPADLGTRGRAFWRRTLAVFDLSEVELELLRECSRLLDECEALRGSVDVDGVTVKGSAGQVRVHPALSELRSHRLALGKLLAQLALPDEDMDALPSPTRARAQKAAATRWRAKAGA